MQAKQQMEALKENNDFNSNILNNNQYKGNQSLQKEKSSSNNNNLHQLPQQNPKINYQQQFKQLFLANIALLSEIKEIKSENNDLISKISTYYYSQNINRSDAKYNYENKKKRLRRAAEEIDRHYICPVENCEKSYGSEGSLHQHLKLKHPQRYEKYLQNLINQQLQREKQQKKN